MSRKNVGNTWADNTWPLSIKGRMQTHISVLFSHLGFHSLWNFSGIIVHRGYAKGSSWPWLLSRGQKTKNIWGPCRQVIFLEGISMTFYSEGHCSHMISDSLKSLLQWRVFERLRNDKIEMKKIDEIDWQGVGFATSYSSIPLFCIILEVHSTPGWRSVPKKLRLRSWSGPVSG